MSKLVKQIAQTAQTTTLAITAIWISLAIQSTAIHAQTGDFNGDGLWNCADAQELSNAVLSNGSLLTFDLNGDGVLNQSDMSNWLGLAGDANLGPGESYIYGDMNFDGSVDAADTDIIQLNRYANTGDFCQGDLNLDGRVDAYDNAVAHANLFSNYQTVDGFGSDGTPTPGQLDVFYDPNSGNLWLDAGGDVLNGWAIPGVQALEHNELNQLLSFGTITGQPTFFAGAEQITDRGFPATGIFQLSRYPTGLTSSDFGEVIATRLPGRPSFDGLPFQTVSPRSANVTIAAINAWNGGSGSWNSANWQNGSAPSAGEVAILDFGTGSVTIDNNETVTSIQTLVRSGTLTIDGVHAGDVSVFDSSATAERPPNSAMASISGGGQIDGSLALMGRFRLEEPETLVVSGEAVLSQGYNVVSPGGIVSGQAQLDLAADFSLAVGDSTGEFALISAAEGLEGTFFELSVGDEFGTGDLFVQSLTYTETEVLVSLGRSLPGDANRDGVVDVSDFNIWNEFKFTSDSTWGTGDFNGDGFTDASDFNVWNENKFTGENLKAVPEPATGTLAVMSMLGLSCLARRSKRSAG